MHKEHLFRLHAQRTPRRDRSVCPSPEHTPLERQSAPAMKRTDLPPVQCRAQLTKHRISNSSTHDLRMQTPMYTHNRHTTKYCHTNISGRKTQRHMQQKLSNDVLWQINTKVIGEQCSCHHDNHARETLVQPNTAGIKRRYKISHGGSLRGRQSTKGGQ